MAKNTEGMTDEEVRLFEAMRVPILDLMQNFGRNGNSGITDSWTKTAIEQGFTVPEVEAAVRRCKAEWPDKFGPQGFAAFAKSIKRKTGPPKAREMPWFSSTDGDWGGDWTDVPVHRWLTAAGLFMGQYGHMTDGDKRRVDDFMKHARRRLSNDDIERAAAAQKAGTLSRFVGEWRESRRKTEQPQEALEV